jgi:hypothetical protein
MASRGIKQINVRYTGLPEESYEVEIDQLISVKYPEKEDYDNPLIGVMNNHDGYNGGQFFNFIFQNGSPGFRVNFLYERFLAKKGNIAFIDTYHELEEDGMTLKGF